MSTAAPTSPAPTANGNHQPNGRFAPGNRAGTGNPFARQVAALRQALLDSVTAADVAEVAQALLARAKQGDVAAAKLLLSYLVGKPEPAPDPDKLDHEEWQHFQEQNALARQLPQVVGGQDLSLPLAMARTLRPMLASVAGGKAQRILNLPDKDVRDITNDPRRLDDLLAEMPRKPKAKPAPSANGSNGHAAPPTDLPPQLAQLMELLKERTAPPAANGHGAPAQ